jgi:hypothetical protein
MGFIPDDLGKLIEELSHSFYQLAHVERPRLSFSD